MTERLPDWAQDWLGVITPALQILLIILAAMLVRSIARRLVKRLGRSDNIPPELLVGARRVADTLIYAAALLLILDRLGVSGTVLWTAFTGFAAVGAIAFFAAWSVLSNVFCTILIFVTRPFRVHDHIEVLEGGDKPGLKGRVIDINLVYTTLLEVTTGEDGERPTLRVPNNMFFQRTVRRWPGGSVPKQWLD